MISSRPATETIEILRRTLLEIERDIDPVADSASLVELKRIVLRRIAELEAKRAHERQVSGSQRTSQKAA